MPQLPTAVTHAAPAPLSATSAQVHVQVTAAFLIGVDVPIDPFMARKPSAAGNLFGAEVFGQQGFDPGDARAVYAWPLAGAAAALPAFAVRMLRVIAQLAAIAPQLPADGAGCAADHPCDAAHRKAGLAIDVDEVSFFLVQAA